LLVGGMALSTDVAALVSSGRVHLVGGSASRREAPRVLVAGEGTDEERDGPGARAHIPSSAHRAASAGLTRGPVLLQVPRRGYLPAMSCATCRAPARCPQCQGPLALPSPQGTPECGWCGCAPHGFVCPHCDGDRLRAGIIGARRTAEEIGRSFPGTRVITSGAGEVQESVGPDPAIVVATPGAEPVAEGGYATVLLLDAWASLDRPDLRASEEAVRRWFAAAGLARSWTSGGVVVLCGAPSHVTIPPVETLVRWDPQWFAGRELAERAELALPPTTWTAEVVAERKRIEPIEHAVRAVAPRAELLGPLPVVGAEERRRLVVKASFGEGPLIAAALKDLRAGESARKATDLTSVTVGHLSAF
ncbi:MAG: primosome assembly protein PriA, partial [Janibacter sp.]